MATQVRQQLGDWLRAPEAVAPLLLVGHDEDALRQLAAFAVHSVVCAQQPPCGTCVACRQVAANTHPAVIRVQDEEKTIRMEEVKALVQQAHLSAWHGKQLVVIPRAERLSGAAINALLKTLEEPTATSRYLLWSTFKRQLLKTLISRCTVVSVRATTVSAHAEVALPVFGQQREGLTPEQLAAIAADLQHQLQKTGVTSALKKAFVRLRDYYKIRSLKGNAKLAQEVLLATLTELRS